MCSPRERQAEASLACALAGSCRRRTSNRQVVTQIGQRSDDAVISPAGILTRHSHHQGFHFRLNCGAAGILPVFGAIELLGDEPSIPGQDGVGFGDAGDLSERFASQRFPISARVARSGSLNRNLDGSFALRIRFSAARYSFCSRSSWFTEPVTYASSRTHFLFLMPTAYLTLATGRFSFLTIRASNPSRDRNRIAQRATLAEPRNRFFTARKRLRDA